MTASTLARLNELATQSRFDERRFRMNILIKTDQPGFVLLDPRCIMTTLAQEDLAQDTEVLRTLARYNRVQLPGLGQFPCAGAYAVVNNQGAVQVGNPVLT